MTRTGTMWKSLLLLSVASFAAHAGDGVIEINQAKAEAGEVTPRASRSRSAKPAATGSPETSPFRTRVRRPLKSPPTTSRWI